MRHRPTATPPPSPIIIREDELDGHRRLFGAVLTGQARPTWIPVGQCDASCTQPHQQAS